MLRSRKARKGDKTRRIENAENHEKERDYWQ